MILHECSCHIELIKRVGGKEIKCQACLAFNLFFATRLIKINNTGARMLDSFYHMTLRLV